MTRGKPPLLVVAGPTGVGKTAAVVALARRLPLEVISADSRQVYRGMDAATGKPTTTGNRPRLRTAAIAASASARKRAA